MPGAMRPGATAIGAFGALGWKPMSGRPLGPSCGIPMGPLGSPNPGGPLGGPSGPGIAFLKGDGPSPGAGHAFFMIVGWSGAIGGRSVFLGSGSKPGGPFGRPSPGPGIAFLKGCGP